MAKNSKKDFNIYNLYMSRDIFNYDLKDEKLTSINRTIIQFIQEDPFAVLNLSIEDFAKQCYTTKSSIVQTLKKVGISGYKELKNKIINKIKSEESSLEDFKESTETINNIKATEIHLNKALKNEASILVSGAKKVVIIGGGSISYMGAILSDQLNKMGIRSSWYEVQDSKIMSEKVDVVIFLSNSGKNEFILKKAKFFSNKKDVKIISITASNDTNIAEYSDFHLPGSRLFGITKKEYHLPTTSISIIWFIIENFVKEIFSIIKKENPNIVENI